MSDETPAAAPEKSRKKLILFAALGLVLACAGAGAGAAWFMLRKPADGTHVVEKKPQAKPVFTSLDVFTVNLQDARGERFAQVGVTLQLKDTATENELKERLPAVRNEILLLLSSKRVDELLADEGKRELAQQIRARTAQAMGLVVAALPAAAAAASAPSAVKPAPMENPVQDVLFSQFIVQ